ncbi:hypothetical protein [Polyangium aurulentum]|uniref:hypothetical protein n=1 Tax=Polyangium aurulentum TaxID=2567896 RepID=UPI001F301394|nr:hypothetical protein [Polyangium aurulentum]
MSAAGCLDRPLEPVEPRTTATIVERLTQSSVDKIDILLAIDNSRSMADKQKILELAVPDLVRGLVNPRCLDDAGAPAQVQPMGPLEECPAGTTREFEPVVNIHIGIISSSIGGHGADSCPDIDQNSDECSPNPNTTNNDKGHLLARLSQCGGQDVTTWNDKKFLVWDPDQMNPTHSPPGEFVIDDGNGNGIVPSLSKMVIGAGQVGCGYESQLESWYRFLVDPNPYETISVKDGKAIPAGTDAVLLQQRAEFLRPDSLLAIVMLTDENDCSIKEYGQFYYVGQLRVGATNVRIPRARQECTTKGPNDPCCKSCGQSDGECGPDPTCKNAQGQTALLAPEEDNINLRCWDQKRRFGIDFLYPTDRYTKALSSTSVEDRDGNIVPNPLFSDLKPDDNISNVRDPGLVFMAGIIGVPWQDVARDKTDLTKGFKSAAELSAPIEGSPGVTTWDVILGDPANDVKPQDPLMIESVAKRTGTNPITGAVLVDATSPMPNPINGHEWTIPNDDLQYACIFDLLPQQQRDCTDPTQTACDCFDANNDNPLCQPDPNTMAPTVQAKAKAYPGLRELAVLRGIGDQGIVASVCPANIANPAGADFGYRPAIGAIIDRLKTVLGGQCLPRTLTPDKQGDVPCLILEARNTQGKCSCDESKARIPVSEEHKQAEEVARQDPLATNAGWDCFCEIQQTSTPEAREACQNDLANPPLVSGQPVNGWCYVDATTTPPTGNAEIVAKCPENEKRIIRFVGEGEAQIGATLFITCSGE